MHLKVGELAKRSGISVRTLHHYDEIGLLSPSQRSEAGHRLYTDEDVLRLQQVISLRSLGFSLEQIGEFLKAQTNSPLRILEMHLEKLRQESEERQKLISNLEKIACAMRTGQNPTVEELLKLMEGISMYAKYYSPEQMTSLKERAETLGEAKIHEVENDWLVLIKEVQIEMANGADPASARMQALATQWQKLLELFTGGDAGIARSCANMYQQEGPQTASRGAMDGEVFAFMGKAIEHLQQNS